VAARGLGVALEAPGGGHLLAPVETDVEGPLADELLGGVAAAVAGDVAGGHGHEVRGDAQLAAEFGQSGGAEQVDLHGQVERGVERHRGGRVDDHLRGGELRPTVGIEAQAVGADVAGDRGHPAGDHLVEAAAELGPQPVERVVLEDLLAGTLGGGGATAAADQQEQLAVGDAAQQPLDQRGADEAGRSGDGDAFARERLGDHGGHV
jgi:hypothetical protein